MENLIKFIERTSEYLTEEEKLWTFMDPLRIYQQSLDLEKRDGKRICMFLDKKIELSPVLFNALYKMAKNPNISHDLVDDCDSDNERQIKHRINEKFKELGFGNIVVKQRKIDGYKINTNLIPQQFIIVK